MEMSFDRIEKKSLVAETTERIQDFILDNDLEAGAALPGEVELASRLGISRSVVREALSRLRHLKATTLTGTIASAEA